MKPEIIRSKSFVEDAVALIAKTAEASIKESGFFRISLSGGNTPKPVYEALAARDLNWSKWILTFGDERCVPPDDVKSNYRMASESLLARAKPGEVFRLKGEIDPGEAAAEYDETLNRLAARFGEKRYSNDLILLGLGDDGHTSSLFPGTSALNERERNIVSNFVPKFDSYRLTSTYPLINAGRQIIFLVNDSKKEQVIQHVIEGGHGFPAEKVSSAEGQTIWLLGE